MPPGQSRAYGRPAERLGFPLIVKPIAAWLADTYRADSAADLDAILPMLRHVPQGQSVEEFVDAEEYDLRPVCADGRVLSNIELVSSAPAAHRDARVDQPHRCRRCATWTRPIFESGRALGAAVLRVLGFRDGFTDMERYRKPDGEVVFGEIAARPPGGRQVDLMNYVTDADLLGLAELSRTGGSRSPSSGATTLRASSGQGAGRITDTRVSTACWPRRRARGRG